MKSFFILSLLFSITAIANTSKSACKNEALSEAWERLHPTRPGMVTRNAELPIRLIPLKPVIDQARDEIAYHVRFFDGSSYGVETVILKLSNCAVLN